MPTGHWIVGASALGVAATLMVVGHNLGPAAAGPAPFERADALLVTPAWLAANLESDVVVLHVAPRPDAPDALQRSTYEAEHIPGARYVPWESIAAPLEGCPNAIPPMEALVAAVQRLGLEAGQRIVLYDTGAGLEAARAFTVLDYCGLADRAALLDGQWAAWIGENRLTTTIVPAVLPSTTLPQPRPEMLIATAQVADVAWLVERGRRGLALIDARPPEQFAGRIPGAAILRAGHIPGSQNLYWRDCVANGPQPHVRPESELRALLARRGVRPDTLTVVTCRTGVEASYLYFVGKLLGQDVRFYAGAYVEWQAAADRPVGP